MKAMRTKRIELPKSENALVEYILSFCCDLLANLKNPVSMPKVSITNKKAMYEYKLVTTPYSSGRKIRE
jgi:hypothetical protein